MRLVDTCKRASCCWLFLFGLLALPAQAEMVGPQRPNAVVSEDVPMLLLQRSVDSLLNDQPTWLQSLLPQLSPHHAELLIYRSLSYLQQNRILPGPRLRVWLQELSNHAPLTQQSTVVEGYEVIMPSYDYPAIARNLLSHQVSAERSQLYLQQLLTEQFHWQLIFRRDNKLLQAQQQDVLKAMSSMTRAQVAYIYERLPEDLFFPDNSVRTAFAMRSGKADAMQQILEAPMDQYSVELLEWIRLSQPPEQAFYWLKQASLNGELIYFAYSAIARLGRSHPPAAQYILEQYRNPERKQLASLVMVEMQVEE